jgi:heat shock protein HtpX
MSATENHASPSDGASNHGAAPENPSPINLPGKSSSIAGRAMLAVVLMIGFYFLALGIALGLLYIPYAELVYAHRIHAKIALGCLIGALAILWSVLPRFDRFEAPGPELTRAKQPRLFDEIEGVAKSVGQAMPAEVYLVPDVNAWVTQRGGLMGFGSRRVMGLGLSLMRVLTRSQMRAVVAHEFGHYYGGDTKLGPWIYKTRGAIGRTLSSLAGEKGEGSILQWPFVWYGKMFLRITHAVSRRQEFMADELAARAVGSKPLIDGLRTVHGVGPAFQAYWANECSPVLGAGFLPPLTEGFEQFVRSSTISEIVAKALDAEMKEGKADPYDTHPPLKERIAAVANLPPGNLAATDPPASSLLEDVLALEAQLLATLAGAEQAGKLQRIGWSDVGTRVYVPQWASLVKANPAALSGLTPESLPKWAGDLKTLGQRCVHIGGQKVEEEDAEGMAGAVVGAALAMLLVSRGGKADTEPGKPIWVVWEGRRFEPFNVLKALAAGRISAADWQRQCAELAIADTDLGTVATAGAELGGAGHTKP